MPHIHKARSRSVDWLLALTRLTAVGLIAEPDAGPLSISPEDEQWLHRLRRSAVDGRAAYTKEYVPLAVKELKESGQKQLAAGGKTASISGEPPKERIVLSVFDSLEKAQAAYTSPAYLEARKIGDKYAKLRIFVVEGKAQ